VTEIVKLVEGIKLKRGREAPTTVEEGRRMKTDDMRAKRLGMIDHVPRYLTKPNHIDKKEEINLCCLSTRENDDLIRLGW
jgi:hypothetical protein